MREAAQRADRPELILVVNEAVPSAPAHQSDAPRFDLEAREIDAQRLGIPVEHLPLDVYRLPVSPEEHAERARAVERDQRARLEAHARRLEEEEARAGERRLERVGEWIGRLCLGLGGMVFLLEVYRRWGGVGLATCAVVSVGLVGLAAVGLWLVDLARCQPELWPGGPIPSDATAAAPDRPGGPRP